MTILQILFLLVAVVTLFAAVMTVTSHRMMRSALWLILCLLGVGASYVLLEASFFAIVQVLVYVGAIAILILFAIMLTRKSMVDVGSQTNPGWIVVMIVLLLGCAGLVLAIFTWPRSM
jgi:NADH-quinone oxidoreductase subunit J